ncbi:MAG: dephospho-CoA kinase [Opitutaceae bacterium]
MKIGLTGGIGCGKSTVVGFFAEAGWRTLESDSIAREVMNNSEGVQSAIRKRWGSAVFSSDGVIDRKAVAAIVFSKNEELLWLEQILHPQVREVWSNQLSLDLNSNWLVEIPLLFEKRLETQFDLSVCVSCPPDVVEARMVRRGYTGVEVEQRRSRQLPLQEKAQRADRVISNAGSLEFLKRQTLRLISELSA